MKGKLVYEAISRVASDKKIIGFMVRPIGKKNEVYMSIDVISFGLSEDTFEIKDVKLGNSGKPRGCNGFLLSKLPIVDLEDNNSVNIKLYRVLLFVVRELGIDEDIKKAIKFGRIGITANCSVRVQLEEYESMDVDAANDDLGKTLRFYLKHLPKELKGFVEKIEGTVEEKGYTILSVSASLVKGEDER
jgi:hypothetical protein